MVENTVFYKAYLADRIGESLDDFLMRCGHNTLAVYLNNTMTNPHASSLCDPSSH